MGDCPPSGSANIHWGSLSGFPAQAKNPIIALSVVFSVVVVVSVIVVVFLVRKIMQLKKVGTDAGARLKVNAPDVDLNSSIHVPDLEADLKNLKGKVPNVDVNVHKPRISASIGADIGADISGGLHAGFDKTVELGKAAIHAVGNAELDIGLSLDHPFYVLFNSLPYASILVDTKGIIVRANNAVRLKWGYASADLEGKIYKTLVSPRNLDVRMELVDELIKGKKVNFDVDGFDQKIDGVEIEVEVLGTVIHILGKTYLFIITGHVCYTANGKRHKDI